MVKVPLQKPVCSILLDALGHVVTQQEGPHQKTNMPGPSSENTAAGTPVLHE